MNLASKDTGCQGTITPSSGQQKAQTPPPLSVSLNVKKNQDLVEPCKLDCGQRVKIYATRADRFKYIELTGRVAAVIYPHDVDRAIIYVALDSGKGTPCFFASEVRPCQ